MRHRRTSPRVVLAVAVAAGSTVLAGCTSSEAASGAATTTAPRVEGAGMSHGDAEPSPWGSGVKCTMRMPGELLQPHEAVVVFDREHVCLGYVTVTAGTPVMWRNTDVVDHTVTIVDSDGRQVRTFGVPAGELTTTKPMGEAGVFRYELSALPEFTGTIEAQPT